MNNIFITGGTGTIGRELVAHFLKKNWKVITTTRDLGKVTQLQNDLSLTKDEKSRLKVLELNLSDKNYINKIKKYFLGNSTLMPKVLVNNARSIETLRIESSGYSSAEMLLSEYMIDVVASYEIAVLLYENYEASAPIQYSLAKAAVIHLTKELAIRFREKAIRVNTVSFGGVEGRVDDEFKKKYAVLCPQGKMLLPEQIVGPIDFLATSKSIGITGQNIVMDGGWTIW